MPKIENDKKAVVVLSVVTHCLLKKGKKQYITLALDITSQFFAYICTSKNTIRKQFYPSNEKNNTVFCGTNFNVIIMY